MILFSRCLGFSCEGMPTHVTELPLPLPLLDEDSSLYCRGGAFAIPPAAAVYTAASLIVPSLASIFNEWALKRRMETSVHLQVRQCCSSKVQGCERQKMKRAVE